MDRLPGDVICSVTDLLLPADLVNFAVTCKKILWFLDRRLVAHKKLLAKY